MKKTVPILITALCGIVLAISPFLPATVSWGETASVWFDVLAAIAFILGGGNLLKVHFSKVNRKDDGWAYSAIILIAFLATLAGGLFKVGVPPARDQEFRGKSFVALKLAELPDEMISTVNLKVELPEPFEIPASVKRQLIVTENRKDSHLLTFKGWIQPFQISDLKDVSKKLEWLRAIEELAEVAVPPAELQGKITYYGDHQSLSAAGMLDEQQSTALLALSEDAQWKTAAEQLLQQANQTRSFEAATLNLPTWFVVPDSMSNLSLNEDRSQLTLAGPLSDAQIEELSRSGAPKITAWRVEDYQSFVHQLEQQIEMTKEQTVSLQKSFTVEMLAENLIKELNLAGTAKAGEYTAKQMLEQKEKGDVVQAVKPAGESLTVSDAQAEVILQFFSSDQVAQEQLLSQLQQTEAWPEQFDGVVASYFQDSPSQADFKADMFELLSATYEGAIPFPKTLSPEATETLLADYRTERLWKRSLNQIADQMHQTKYAWSGAYRANGSFFWWLYEYAFKPLTATMFALLAFYVASAAFRAFRAKNLEAILLLGTAFIILAGRTPLGVAMTSWLPESLSLLKVENITMIVMTVFNTAGNRAIMIGIALGIASTSLKILMGVDRSYLGSDD